MNLHTLLVCILLFAPRIFAAEGNETSGGGGLRRTTSVPRDLNTAKNFGAAGGASEEESDEAIAGLIAAEVAIAPYADDEGDDDAWGHNQAEICSAAAAAASGGDHGDWFDRARRHGFLSYLGCGLDGALFLPVYGMPALFDEIAVLSLTQSNHSVLPRLLEIARRMGITFASNREPRTIADFLNVIRMTLERVVARRDGQFISLYHQFVIPFFHLFYALTAFQRPILSAQAERELHQIARIIQVEMWKYLRADASMQDDGLVVALMQYLSRGRVTMNLAPFVLPLSAYFGSVQYQIALWARIMEGLVPRLKPDQLVAFRTAMLGGGDIAPLVFRLLARELTEGRDTKQFTSKILLALARMVLSDPNMDPRTLLDTMERLLSRGENDLSVTERIFLGLILDMPYHLATSAYLMVPSAANAAVLQTLGVLYQRYHMWVSPRARPAIEGRRFTRASSLGLETAHAQIAAALRRSLDEVAASKK